MTVDGIIYGFVIAITSAFFLLGAVILGSLYYVKTLEEKWEREFLPTYRGLRKVYGDSGLSVHELLLIFTLVTIGCVWGLCIFPLFRIPLLFTALGLSEVSIMIYVMDTKGIKR